MRQQLVWVVGSLIPVVIAFTLPQGDATMAVLAALGGLTYVSGRRAAHAPRSCGGTTATRDGDVGEAGVGDGTPASPGASSSVSTCSASACGRRSPNWA